MNLRRLFRHLAMVPWHLRRCFPPESLTTIEVAIADGEASHGGQICFAIEAALSTGALLRGVSARERAIEIFSRLRVWDTEGNNGVLIYLLLADRDVEIVADRGLASRVSQADWEAICRRMEAAFGQGEYRAGLLIGIEEVRQRLAGHFPPAGAGNELPDRPAIL